MRGCPGHHLLSKRGIRPGIAIQLCFYRRQRAVAFRAHLYLDLGGMPLGVGDQAFVAIIQQLDRASGHVGEQGRMDLPGNILFAAKAATDQPPNNANAAFRPSERLGLLLSIRIGDLRANMDLHPSVGQRAGNRAFWFEKSMVIHPRMVGAFQDHIRFLETLFHLTFPHFYML
jgi:hypothetical protein